MSAFWTNCGVCGARYFHMFVGRSLLAGHECERDASEVCTVGWHDECMLGGCECQCHSNQLNQTEEETHG